jgi:CRISPR-associated protein Cmr4
MTQHNAILGLLAQTSIHAGTGRNTGVIDLTIQREGHNGWPCVFGSAVKGALRAHAEEHYQDNTDNRLIQTFGPDTDNADAHAGALSVMDARLLLLPVRSLTSQFRWVTCVNALKRYGRDAQRLGITVDTITLPEPAAEHAYVYAGQTDLFLEEYRYTCDAKGKELDAIIGLLAGLMQRDGAAEELQKQLVIVSNDDFSFLVQHATPVNAHIAIESETKTVRGGALWYEETLPPETLLYVGMNAFKGRTDTSKKQAEPLSATAILQTVTGMFITPHHWLQVGGNETVGMGWCAVKVQEA